MSKIIINDLLDKTSFLADANERFQQVEDEFNNKVLYRANPAGEPNGMSNDLDMQEHNILNVDTIDANSAVIGGKPFNPAEDVFVELTQYTPEQAVQDERISNLEAGEIEDIRTSTVNDTNLALDFDKTGKDYVLELGPNTNRNYGGLAQLNLIGKIPNELILMAITDLKGFWRGDDECPKPLDSILTPENVANCAVDADYRNPTQLYAQYTETKLFVTGSLYIVRFSASSGNAGMINLRDPDDPLAPEAPTAVEQGDAIIYLEQQETGEGVVTAEAGWYRWGGAVSTTTALDTIVDTTEFNEFLSPAHVNVQAALDYIDDETVGQAEFVAEKARVDGIVSDNTALISSNDGDILAIEADIIAQGLLIQGNTELIEDPVTGLRPEVDANTSKNLTQDTAISDNTTLANTKIGSGDYATPDGVTPGTVRVDYDEVNNILNLYTHS